MILLTGGRYLIDPIKDKTFRKMLKSDNRFVDAGDKTYRLFVPVDRKEKPQ